MQITDISQFPQVSKLVSSDKKLLQDTVARIRPYSDAYEDSWGYIIQATRYGGFKWYDSDNKALIFFGRKSESDSTLVIPAFFADPQYLSHAISKIQKLFNSSQTILKNINPIDIKKFTPYGFRVYKEGESWSVEMRFDDQTYPQLIINLEKIVEPKGTNYHHLKKALNKKPNYIFRKYYPLDADEVFQLFALKDYNCGNALERTKGMYFTSHAMYPKSDIDKYVIAEKSTGKIIGFTATSNISSVNTAFVAGIFKPGMKVASIWGIYKTLLAKHYEGFKLVNLGGCETLGPHNFLKGTFRPDKMVYKTHLIYDI